MRRVTKRSWIKALPDPQPRQAKLVAIQAEHMHKQREVIRRTFQTRPT